MPHTPTSTAHAHPARTKLARTLLGLLYFGALTTLILWEFRDRFDFFSTECALVDAPPRSALYARPYRQFLDWTSIEAPTQVSVVAIPLELDEFQNNICLTRSYLADLIRTAAEQHPAEIVLDKFFGPASCPSDPSSTNELMAVVRSLPVPIVIAESSGAASERRDEACLVRKPQLDFNAPNVHHGLARLNSETEMVPLEWRILSPEASSAPHEAHPKSEIADSLAWASVKVYDPAYAVRPRIQALIDSDRHPYARLDDELPRQTSTELLCNFGTEATRKRWSTDCSGPPKRPNLLGKIVVIGSEGPADRRVILGRQTFGLDLQARYIEALLSGNYLRALPISAAFFLFACFVFMIEGLPTVLEAFRPRWKKNKLLSYAYKRRRYVWVIFWAIAFLCITSVIPLSLRYLPPLDVLGDIAFVAITRLLFFAAESTETPLVHGHAKKKGAH